MESCIYEGTIRHQRFAPIENRFQYRICMVFIDLAELDDLLENQWLFSTRRWSPIRFKRSDYFGDPSLPLDQAVRDHVERETGSRPAGPIRLLTHLRYFGYCFNPVSFYYCYDETGSRIETILAEITNTPWGERHAYLLAAGENEADAPRFRFRFNKAFHISPFMGMQQSYDWRLTQPGPGLSVHMENLEAGRRLLDATLLLKRRELGSAGLAQAMLRYPLITLKVIVMIHYQALRLWWKGCPFHPHPDRTHLTTESCS